MMKIHSEKGKGYEAFKAAKWPSQRLYIHRPASSGTPILKEGMLLLMFIALAGMAGLEPANEGVKVPCLTAWPHPYQKEEGSPRRDSPDHRPREHL